VSGKRPAHTPVSRSTDELDRRLRETLAAHQGPAGICPTVPRLAGLLGVSVSTVQRSLRRLVAAGLVERVAVHELPDDPEWQRRGHRISHKGRQTSNSYRLLVTPGPGVTASEGTAGQTPVSPDFVTPLEGKEQAGGGYQGSTDEGEAALIPAGPVEIDLDVPAALLLAHDPGVTEILGTLGRAFGEVLVLEGPATYRTARGRVVDLATASADDLDIAVEQLRRHTCNGGHCRDGEPCRRHAPRRPL
jgi:DNA-binding transcriptional ArsR family regulator